jgi:predicted nucleotide-binding protein (sugar kinase/HSP70/actin superfamily)
MTNITPDLATKVEYILNKWNATKDNDMLLVAQFWALESKFSEQHSAYDVFEAMSKGALSSYESITRARRKLQEIKPELRGSTWEKRHNKEKQVIEDVRNIK